MVAEHTTSKDTDPVTEDVGPGDSSNMVFSDAAGTYGRGRAMVMATGMHTEMSEIASLLRQTESEPTPLQEELNRTGKLLGIVVVIIALVMILTILLVEGIREFMAVLVVSVRRMATRNAIVRKLPAVETLGSATVIALDKTGTLTKNEMTVRTIVTANGQVVAMTGDGVDDASALKTANIGVVLASVLGLTASGNEVIIAPLLATQFLWINLVTDGARAGGGPRPGRS